MIDINQLMRQLTFDEYESGKDLFLQLRERGVPTVKAAGLVYRAGRLAGKKDNGAELHRLHEIIKDLKARLPEAEKKEGDTSDE